MGESGRVLANRQPIGGPSMGTRGMRRTLVTAAAMLVAALFNGAVSAQDAVNTGYFGGVAIMGYDPVAYFTDNRAVKGSEEYSYDWLGTPWHFATNDHKPMMAGDPIKFGPEYGGYCTGEVALGSVTIDIDPEAFKIIDGKLYLIYD